MRPVYPILWTILSACFGTVEPPDVVQGKSFEGERFTLSYPGNWKILKSENDYDPEHHFRIVSKNTPCNVVFHLHEPPVELRPELEKIAKQRSIITYSPEIEPTKNWGRNVGQGILIDGFLDEEKTRPTHYLVFGMQRRLVTVTVVEECESRFVELEKPGFTLISSTFTLR